jgi:hypothetical protein
MDLEISQRLDELINARRGVLPIVSGSFIVYGQRATWPEKHGEDCQSADDAAATLKLSGFLAIKSEKMDSPNQPSSRSPLSSCRRSKRSDKQEQTVRTQIDVCAKDVYSY